MLLWAHSCCSLTATIMLPTLSYSTTCSRCMLCCHAAAYALFRGSPSMWLSFSTADFCTQTFCEISSTPYITRTRAPVVGVITAQHSTMHKACPDKLLVCSCPRSAAGLTVFDDLASGVGALRVDKDLNVSGICQACIQTGRGLVHCSAMPRLGHH